MDKIDKFIDDLEETFAYVREREGGDSVCGLCEYDGAYIGESGDWCNECPGFNKDDCFKLSDDTRKKWTDEILTICKHFGNGSEIPNSSDTINRQDAIDAINGLHDKPNAWLDLAVDALEKLPSAQPERERGEWIDRNGNIVCPFWKHYECSECGARSGNTNYCPNCGAYMKGGTT